MSFSKRKSIMHYICKFHNENIDFIDSFNRIKLTKINEDSYQSQLRCFKLRDIDTSQFHYVARVYFAFFKPSGLPSGGIFRWRGTDPAKKSLAQSEGEGKVALS